MFQTAIVLRRLHKDWGITKRPEFMKYHRLIREIENVSHGAFLDCPTWYYKKDLEDLLNMDLTERLKRKGVKGEIVPLKPACVIVMSELYKAKSKKK